MSRGFGVRSESALADHFGAEALPTSGVDVDRTANTPVPVGFELAVFERRGAALEVRLFGMTACCDLDVVAFENAAGTTISVTGTLAQGRIRPYQVSVTVEAAGIVQVIGGEHREQVDVARVHEELPVVCGADPRLAGLDGDFLHHRDGRYVRMHAEPDDARRVA